MQDDPDWHRGDSDKYETEGEGELYEFGQECLDRLALSLGGNTVAPLASQMFPPLMANQVQPLPRQASHFCCCLTTNCRLDNGQTVSLC